MNGHNDLCVVDPATRTYKRDLTKGETVFICPDCFFNHRPIERSLPMIEIPDPTTYFSVQSTASLTLRRLAAAITKELERRGEI